MYFQYYSHCNLTFITCSDPFFQLAITHLEYITSVGSVSTLVTAQCCGMSRGVGRSTNTLLVSRIASICKCCNGGRNFQLGRWRCVFDMPPQWRWQISVGVKARDVNWKQVDVAVGCPGMR